MHCFASRVSRLLPCLVVTPALAFPAAAAASVAPSIGLTEPVDLHADARSNERVNFAALGGDGEVLFNIRAGFEHQFRTNIDSGGEFSSSRFGASVSAMSDITPDFDVRFAFGYEFDNYSFRGVTGIGGPNPWDDIHTFSFGVIFGAHLTNEWKVFGGPVFQFSAESGASFSDGFIGGGVIGTSYQVSPELLIGGGIGIVSQIERGTRFFPVVLVDWRITDQLRLTTESATNASGDVGIELVYDWGGGFETALGGQYRFRRFRLDDGGIAPEGVGQHSSFPFWIRLTYHFNPNFQVNLYGGVVFGGELQLRNSGGGLIGKEDYDTDGMIGISGSIRF